MRKILHIVLIKSPDHIYHIQMIYHYSIEAVKFALFNIILTQYYLICLIDIISKRCNLFCLLFYNVTFYFDVNDCNTVL